MKLKLKGIIDGFITYIHAKLLKPNYFSIKKKNVIYLYQINQDEEIW